MKEENIENVVLKINVNDMSIKVGVHQRWRMDCVKEIEGVSTQLTTNREVDIAPTSNILE